MKLAIGAHQVEKKLPNEQQAQVFVCFASQLLDKEEPIQQVMVQWQEGPLEAAIWEDISTVQDQIPEFNLKDKVVAAAADNDRQKSNEKGWKVYYR